MIGPIGVPIIFIGTNSMSLLSVHDNLFFEGMYNDLEVPLLAKRFPFSDTPLQRVAYFITPPLKYARYAYFPVSRTEAGRREEAIYSAMS